MADLVEPDDHHRVQEQSHRRRAFDGQRQAVGGVFHPQELFAGFKRAFDGPAAGIETKDLSSAPVEVGTVEHLVGTFAFEVMRQDDGQQTLAARRHRQTGQVRQHC